MKVFSRRRWRLIYAQLSIKFGYCPSCIDFIVLWFQNHNSLPLDRYEPSSPISCRTPHLGPLKISLPRKWTLTFLTIRTRWGGTTGRERNTGPCGRTPRPLIPCGGSPRGGWSSPRLPSSGWRRSELQAPAPSDDEPWRIRTEKTGCLVSGKRHGTSGFSNETYSLICTVLRCIQNIGYILSFIFSP